MSLYKTGERRGDADAGPPERRTFQILSRARGHGLGDSDPSRGQQCAAASRSSPLPGFIPNRSWRHAKRPSRIGLPSLVVMAKGTRAGRTPTGAHWSALGRPAVATCARHPARPAQSSRGPACHSNLRQRDYQFEVGGKRPSPTHPTPCCALRPAGQLGHHSLRDVKRRSETLSWARGDSWERALARRWKLPLQLLAAVARRSRPAGRDVIPTSGSPKPHHKGSAQNR